MTEFKLGDIVRITRGEPDKPGYRCEVRSVAEVFLGRPGVTKNALRTFKNEGWEIELIERPLPTEPNTLGWATVNGIRRLVRLGVFGQWEAYNKDGALAIKPHPSAIEDFTEAVLIPKDLADKVTEWADNEDGKWRAGGILAQIARHLKGQDDE